MRLSVIVIIEKVNIVFQSYQIMQLNIVVKVERVNLGRCCFDKIIKNYYFFPNMQQTITFATTYPGQPLSHQAATTYQVMQLHVAVKIAVIFHFVFSSLRDKTKC